MQQNLKQIKSPAGKTVERKVPHLLFECVHASELQDNVLVIDVLYTCDNVFQTLVGERRRHARFEPFAKLLELGHRVNFFTPHF